jgi:hypothetical protein
MNENAYIVEAVAGVLYLPVAARLLWRAAKNGQLPERLLGATFAFYGLSYLLFELPELIEVGSLANAIYFSGRLAVAAGVYMIALFTRRVFRPRESWAEGVQMFVAFLIVAGLGLSALQGDWEGSGLHHVGFWLEWFSQLIPCAWICAEGVIQYRLSERRRSLGLSDSQISHQFLLWGGFGLAQTGTMFSILLLYVGYERDGYISASMDALLGSFELVAIAAVWLAFYPPARYRRWIERVSAESSAREKA